jgi:predicted deacylase
MNTGKRFWTMDNTDINRMFPGYDLGETTQRIADGMFNAINDYEYGIHLASFYRDGRFLPHVKMMDAVFEASPDCSDSLGDFGLPYGLLRKPRPYDTTTLNYNWRVWGVKAFSLFSTYTEHIGGLSTQTAVHAILRFLAAKGIVDWGVHKGYHTRVIDEETICYVETNQAGIIRKHVSVGDEVDEGDLLCEIIHPLEGHAIAQVVAPVGGVVFFSYGKQLVMERTDVFKIIP